MENVTGQQKTRDETEEKLCEWQNRAVFKAGMIQSDIKQNLFIGGKEIPDGAGGTFVNHSCHIAI